MMVPLPVTTTLKEERVVLAYSLGGSDAWFVDSVVLGSVVKVGVCGRGWCSAPSHGNQEAKARERRRRPGSIISFEDMLPKDQTSFW